MQGTLHELFFFRINLQVYSYANYCDNIFILEKGELKHQGTFDELLVVSENFRAHAKEVK